MQAPLYVQLEGSGVRASSHYGSGLFTLANLIKLAANRGAGVYRYSADCKPPCLPSNLDAKGLRHGV